MSKLQFRARALDASKPMPIYMAEELPDLTDYSAINRAVPQMPSGMEKEEECEHHLQRAICTGLIIPTPEVASMADVEAYDKIYPANYKQPRQLIHMQPFTMEQEIPDYDMDSEDELWVEEQARRLDLTPLKFESMMDRLEKSSGQTVVTLHDAKALLKEDDDLTIAIFDYWLNKRLKTQHPLILAVKTEHRLGSAANNPYLAFRRRTEKMQTRKNRKNDETSYEKMLKLRRDLSRAVTLLEMVKRREKTKREHLHLTIEIVEKRYQAQDFNGSLLAEVSALRTAQRPAFAPLFTNQYTNQNWNPNKAAIKDEILPRKEKRQYKKRKHKSASSSHSNRNSLNASGLEPLISSDEDDVNSNAMLASSEELDTNEADEGRYAFRRNKYCSYHMPITNKLGNWPWCSREDNGTADSRYRYALTSIRHPKRRCIGFARRRMGRGGRVILDRVTTPYDDVWRELDYTIIETPSLRERLALEKVLTTCEKSEQQQQTVNSDVEMNNSGIDKIKFPNLDINKTCVLSNSNNNNNNNNSVVVTPALRNLYTEHNYNSTTPSSTSVRGGYPPDGHSSPADDDGVQSGYIKNEVTNSVSDIKSDLIATVQVKMEDELQATNWTTTSPSTAQQQQQQQQQTIVLKQEPYDYDLINNSISSQQITDVRNKTNFNEDVSSHTDNTDAMLEILHEIKHEWLHFRPKTPPQDYEPPCDLLPAKEDTFNPTDLQPITVEIENVLNEKQPQQPPSSVLRDTSTFTSEFTLNDIYTDMNLDYQIQQHQHQLLFDPTSSTLCSGDIIGDGDGDVVCNNDLNVNVNQVDDSENNNCSTNDNVTVSSSHSHSHSLSASSSSSSSTSSALSFGCSRVSVSSLLTGSNVVMNKAQCERTCNNSNTSTRGGGGGGVNNNNLNNNNSVLLNDNILLDSIKTQSTNCATAVAAGSLASSPTIRRSIQLLQTLNQQKTTRTQSILSNTLTSPTKSNLITANNSSSCINHQNAVNNSVAAVGVGGGGHQIPTLVFDRVTGNVTSTAANCNLTQVVSNSAANIRMIATGLIRSSANIDQPTITNGPLAAHLEPSLIRRVNCKSITTDDNSSSNVLDGNLRVHRLQNNASIINSQVRRALLSSQTINTLNSNSANFLDPTSSPLTNDTAAAQMAATATPLITSSNDKMKIHHHLTQSVSGGSSAGSGGGGGGISGNGNGNTVASATGSNAAAVASNNQQQPSSNTTNNKQSIMRKNNTLAMEVT